MYQTTKGDVDLPVTIIERLDPILSVARAVVGNPPCRTEIATAARRYPC